MATYYVSHNGEQKGPWSAQEILKRLKSQDLAWSDYVYDEGKADWVLLMDHQEFSSHFKPGGKPTLPKPHKKSDEKHEAHHEQANVNEKEWFVLKAENKYGPFSMLEIIRMLQEKNIFEYDYIWNQAMSTWKRVAEVDEFKPEKIRALKDSGKSDVQEIFFRRRHARAHYGASILVHNNKKVWKGESLELSSGGAGLVIEHPEFNPGQTLFLHFKPGDGVPPFNAICTVVSKQMPMPGRTAVRYGVKFTSINRNVQDAIKDFTENKAA